MYIDEFIWLPDIVEKLAVKHHATQDEVEEVFFIHKPDNTALILTARDMDKKERKRYERK